MKRIRIYMFFLLLAGMVSCIGKEESGFRPEWIGEGEVAVRFTVPSTKAAAAEYTVPTIYAYDVVSFQAGEVKPSAPAFIRDGVYCYNLPECTDILFTTVNPDIMKDCIIEIDASGNVQFKHTGSSVSLPEEILYAHDTAIVPGTVKSVTLKRLSSKLQVNLKTRSYHGEEGKVYGIKDILLDMNGFTQSIIAASDGAQLTGEDVSMKEYLYSFHPGKFFLDRFDFIPSGQVPEVKLTVCFETGEQLHYSKKLTAPLQANRNYDMNIGLVVHEQGFRFESVEIVDSDYLIGDQSPKSSHYLSGNPVVGNKAGNRTEINIYEAFPSECQLISGSEYFSIERVGNSLWVSALQDNVSEYRAGKILVRDGDKEVFYMVYQAMETPQTLKITNPTTSEITCDLSGDEIAVVGGSPETNLKFSVAPGATVTVTGKYIGSYRGPDGVLDASACPYLESVLFNASGKTVDLSPYRSLQFLDLENLPVETLVFGTDSKIRRVAVSSLNSMSTLDLTPIAATLEGFRASQFAKNCAIVIYPVDYAGEKRLKDFYIYGNGSIPSMVGCNHLESVDIYSDLSRAPVLDFRDCSALTRLRVSNNSYEDETPPTVDISGCTSLLAIYMSGPFSRINRTGQEPIVTVAIGGTTFQELDFSGLKSLRRCYSFNCPNVNFSGCENLVSDPDFSVGDAVKVDFTGCGKLEHLALAMNPQVAASEQLIGLTGCTSLKQLRVTGLNKDLPDLSVFPVLETLYLGDIKNIVTLDLSRCQSLKEITMDYICYYDASPLTGILFPAGLLKAEMLHVAGIKQLDMKPLGALESFKGDFITALETADFTGCTGLKFLQLNSSNLMNTLLLGNCPALETLKATSSGLQHLDLSGCPSLRELDLWSSPMDKAGLDQMFQTIVDRSGLPISGYYHVAGTPGENTHDKALANSKGWYN